jgi:diguanylate cyclase (GGDEF)-like protein
VLQASAHADPRTTHLRLRHALWRTARTLGRPTEALEHLEHYLTLERARSLNQLRGQSDLFVTRVEAEQVRLEMQRERARAVELEADTRRDQLTRLGNRREVSLRWPELLGSARSGSTPLSVAMIDIDHFKLINDRFGHAVGDAVLVALSKMLRENTRTDDLVARVGGEEFLLVLPEAPIERAFDICERLRQRVAQHGWDLLAPGLSVTLSAGVTCAPPYEVQSLTRHADDALYRAKREGRNRVIRHGSGPEQRA